MKDQEIDDLLERAAHAPQELKPETLQRIADSIKPSLRPIRPLRPTWMLAGELVLVSAAISLAGAAHSGFFGFEKMDLVHRLLIFPALLVLAGTAATAFVHEMIPGSRRRISSSALLATASIALTAVFLLLFRDYHVDHFVSAGIVCLLTGFLYSVPAGLLSWFLLRRGCALNSVSAGLAAGTLGGLAGVAMLELHCPNFQAAHVLVWHTAVVPLGSAVGALTAWAFRFRVGSTTRTHATPE